MTAPQSPPAGGTLAERIAGLSLTSPEPRPVTRPALRAFARAVGSDHPVHHDVEAARAAGHADLIAPPTYVVTVAQAADLAMLGDPAIGVQLQNVVHGEQSFQHARPVVAGDELTATARVESARMVGGSCMTVLRTEVVDAGGHEVAASRSTLVISAPTAEEAS